MNRLFPIVYLLNIYIVLFSNFSRLLYTNQLTLFTQIPFFDKNALRADMMEMRKSNYDVEWRNHCTLFAKLMIPTFSRELY